MVHLNAHATSTPEGDPVEAQALIKALGPAADGVIVSATKSMTGHLLGGAGAIESIAAIMALRDQDRPAHHQPRGHRRGHNRSTSPPSRGR